MPKLSSIILAIGARQFVVHEALEKTKSSFVITFSFTPNTTVFASGDGAEIITFLAPAITCDRAVRSLKTGLWILKQHQHLIRPKIVLADWDMKKQALLLSLQQFDVL